MIEICQKKLRYTCVDMKKKLDLKTLLLYNCNPKSIQSIFTEWLYHIEEGGDLIDGGNKSNKMKIDAILEALSSVLSRINFQTKISRNTKK